MRTTLTLEDDVAALIRKAERTTKKSFKEIVNDALRTGLLASSQKEKNRPRFVTPTIDAGPCLIGDISSVEEAIELAEGPFHK